MNIRIARPIDANAIAQVHKDGWRAGYGPYLAQNVIDREIEERSKRWASLSADPLPGTQLFVGEKDQEIMMFAHTGPSKEHLGDLEIHSFYVHSSHWGKGLAQSLMSHVLRSAEEHGYQSVYLTAFQESARARRFYEKVGFRETGRSFESLLIDGSKVVDIEYRLLLQERKGQDLRSEMGQSLKTGMNFHPADELEPRSKSVFDQVRRRIKQTLPSADIRHVGSTSIPGALTKGDVDLLVMVEAGQFSEATERLSSIYEIDQPDNWTDSYASFGDDSKDLPVGIQLLVRGDPYELRFLGFRDLLMRNPGLLTDYNELKRAKEGASVEEYNAEKAMFIKRLLAKHQDELDNEREAKG